ncbi:MAG TPA: CopG family antitoxin [Reyranella sp.]|nr:CopG family antitoxin [Reyranella sp.]
MPKKQPATGTRKVPVLRTDEEAEAFLMQDLSDLDFSQFKRMHFEFEKKEAQLNMRVPEGLLDAVKDRAKQKGMPYTRYIRMLMERDIAAK